MTGRTQRDEVVSSVVRRVVVGVMNRQGVVRPLGAVQVVRLLTRAKALSTAATAPPASSLFNGSGKFVPIVRVALAVYGHKIDFLGFLEF